MKDKKIKMILILLVAIIVASISIGATSVRGVVSIMEGNGDEAAVFFVLMVCFMVSTFLVSKLLIDYIKEANEK